MSARHLFYLAVMVFGFSACSGKNAEQTEKSNANQTKQACDLLTFADIQSVVGEPVKEGRHRMATLCQYVSEATDEYGSPKIMVTVRTQEGRQSPEEALNLYMQSMKRGLAADSTSYRSVAVEGLGDLAVWETFTNVSDMAAFKSVGNGKTTMVLIQVTGVDDRVAQSYARFLLSKALQQL